MISHTATKNASEVVNVTTAYTSDTWRLLQIHIDMYRQSLKLQLRGI